MLTMVSSLSKNKDRKDSLSSSAIVKRRDLKTVEARGASESVMMCLALDSKTEATEAGVFCDVEGDSAFESATPRERKIWEDVVSAASCAEALSKVVE